MSFDAPELLTVAHDIDSFDCGSLALNQYLRRFALSNNAAGSARTYVCCSTNSSSVIGYYSLCAGSIEKAAAPERVAKGLPNHPIPIILLARLAVHQPYQSKGIGRGLVKDALMRSLRVADEIGIRAVLTHAKDSKAAQFYSSLGFAPSPTDPLHLMLLVKDIRHSL